MTSRLFFGDRYGSTEIAISAIDGLLLVVVVDGDDVSVVLSQTTILSRVSTTIETMQVDHHVTMILLPEREKDNSVS